MQTKHNQKMSWPQRILVMLLVIMQTFFRNSLCTLIGTSNSKPARNCWDIHRADPTAPSGLYYISYSYGDSQTPDMPSFAEVYCDMQDMVFTFIHCLCLDMLTLLQDSNGNAGWTIIQRRDPNTTEVSFNRSWEEYRDGFGGLWGSHYLGNAKIRILSPLTTPTLSLRIDIVSNDVLHQADYSTFHVGSDADLYQLSVSGFSEQSTVPSDQFSQNSGALFSAYDRDNDGDDLNCAESYQAGWWYHNCSDTDDLKVNLNGEYGAGIIWLGLDSISSVVMKVRPYFSCINRTISCSGHGVCGLADVCTCDMGYFGDSCEQIVSCFGLPFSDTDVCSGQGQCVKTDVCNCNLNLGGQLCNIVGGLGTSSESAATSCLEIHRSSSLLPSGTYWIKQNSAPYQVYCDMDDKDLFGVAGWTVFQRRERATANVDFWNSWEEYKLGFGDLMGSFWLGNLYIHEMTSFQNSSLRIDFQKKDDNALYHENYSLFSLGSENEDFNLIYEGYQVAGRFRGDALSIHNNLPFQTFDTIPAGSMPCATRFRGAWWYASCHNSNLNGFYYVSGLTQWYADGIVWGASGIAGVYSESLLSTAMKTRPIFSCLNRTESCSGHGYCGINDTCICDIGWDSANCSTPICYGIQGDQVDVCHSTGECVSPDICACDEGWAGQDCSLLVCYNRTQVDPLVCSGNGHCQSINYCLCEDGWFGNICQSPICSGTDAVCSGHGSCIFPDTCDCHNNYMGAYCEITTCYSVFSNDSSVCNGRGTCIEFQHCNCTEGYTGLNCESALCFGLSSTDPMVCSGNGLCSSPDSCQCDEYHSGEQCETHNVCYGIDSDNTTVCSGHGACIMPDFCECESGYITINCSVPICNNTAATDYSVCNGRGICTEHNLCECHNNFAGSFCEFSVCNGKNQTDPRVCSGNGFCNSSSQCNCNLGYTGLNCQLPICFGIANNSACSSHGVCRAPDTCQCNVGYIGDLCELPLCFDINATDPRVCGSRGDCIGPDICKCRGFYAGYNCSDTVTITVSSNFEPETVFSRRKQLQISINIQGVPLSTVEMQWQAFINSSTPSGTFQEVEIDLFQLVAQGLLTPYSLTIPGNILLQTSTYRFVIYTRVGLQEWKEELKVKTSTPPLIHTFSVEPSNGTAEQVFTLAVVQNLNNVEYGFFYYDRDTNKEIPLNTFSPQQVLVSNLPSGFGEERELEIRAVARNIGDGDYSTISFTAIVYKSVFEIVERAVSSIDPISDTFLTECISQARNLNDVGPDITIRELSRAKVLVEQLVEKIQSVVTGSERDLAMVPLVVEMITHNTSLLSDTSRQGVLHLVNKLMDPTSGQNTQSMANILSNIADSDFTNTSTSNLFTETMSTFSKNILSLKSANDKATIIQTRNFYLVVDLKNKALIENTRTNTTKGDFIEIPELPQLDSGEIGVTIIDYPRNPYNYSSYQVDNPVIDIKFFQHGQLVSLRNLATPLNINIQKTQISRCSAPEKETRCVYWNEAMSSWESDGCYFINSTNVITCACNHTTSFSAFILYEPCTVPDRKLTINSIAWSAIYILVCIPVLIVIVLLRNQQPLRSRYVAPFIGITAIIIDSALQGVIRNSLVLADFNEKPLNVLSHVIMMTSNPLSLVALVVFLWQQIRYLLFRHIYFVMSVQDSSAKFMTHISRVLASKVAYLVAVISAALFVLIFYAGFTGGVAGSPYDKYKRLSIGRAISYFAMLMVVAGMIVFVLIIDVLTSIRKISRVDEEIDSESGEKMYSKPKFYRKVLNYILRDDPLLFRTEALALAIMVIFLFVYYLVSTVYLLKPSRELGIVQQVLEILFTLTKIAAYGGVVACVTVYQHMTRRSATQVQEEDFILNILHNELGYRLFYQYCESEFSLENLLLWKELEAIRRDNLLTTPANRHTTICYLHNTYCARYCEREVNFNSNLKRKIEDLCGVLEPTTSVSEDLYSAMNLAVLLNIADTMTRFTASEMYAKFTKSQALHVELRTNY